MIPGSGWLAVVDEISCTMEDFKTKRMEGNISIFLSLLLELLFRYMHTYTFIFKLIDDFLKTPHRL